MRASFADHHLRPKSASRARSANLQGDPAPVIRVAAACPERLELVAPGAVAAGDPCARATGQVDGPSVVEEVAALVGDDSQPDDHEILAAILAVEQAAAEAAAQAPLPEVFGEPASVAANGAVAAESPVVADVASAAGGSDSAHAVAPLDALADAATALDEERSAAGAREPQIAGPPDAAATDGTTPAAPAAVDGTTAASDDVTAADVAVIDEAPLEQSVTVG